MPAAPRATVVVVHDGRVALIERVRDDRRYWAVPGGGVEEGEDPADAAVREAAEELGLVVRVVRKLAERHDLSPAARPLAHVFLCSVDDPTFGPMTGPEASRATARNTYTPRWVPIDHAADLVQGVVGELLRRYRDVGSWPPGAVRSAEG